MTAPPLVSVIVVTYNSRAHLEECLTALCALEAEPRFEIIVLDNASTDDSHALAERYAAQHRFVQARHSAVNRGYAGGVNAALEFARGDYIAILNPDMRVTPNWLGPLVAFMEAHPEAGAVNPLILLQSDEALINAAGQDDHITGLGFNRWLGSPRARLKDLRPARVSGVQGGAVLLRRAVLARMGGWDESGFMYHEDVELSWLLQLMGHDLYCVPEAVVSHAYHLTMYPEKLFLLERNRWAMLLTHLGGAARLLIAPFLLMTEAMLWGYCLLRGPAFLKAKAASYVWLFQQTDMLAQRRAHVRALRQRSDWQLLRQLAWGYAWDQFFTLGKERGHSRRQPAGGMPVDLSAGR